MTEADDSGRPALTVRGLAAWSYLLFVGLLGLSILTLLARPRSPAHDLLVGLLGLGLAAALAVPFLRTFFDLHLPDAATWIAVVCVTAAAHTLLWISSRRALSS